MDPLLAPFLKAPPGAGADEACWTLFNQIIDPALKAFAARRSEGGGHSTEHLDMEDTLSETRLRLVNKLYDLKAGAETSEIESLKAYVFTVAESVRAETLRKKCPNRTALSSRIRYLLDGNTHHRGFAIWSADGELVAGFHAWEGRPAETSHRCQTLVAHPPDYREKALAQVGSGHPLAEMIAAALNWVGGPIRFHALVTVLAEWTDTHDHVQTLDSTDDEDEMPVDLPDPAAGPDEQLIWLECLALLWQTILECALKWRIAFLLKSHVTHEFVHYRVTSLSGLAKGLEMPPQALLEFWNDIPLDDLEIAARLKLERQQVINLRSIARRAFHEKLRPLLEQNFSAKSQ